MNENYNNDTPGKMEAAVIDLVAHYESKLAKQQEENDTQLAIHISTIEQQNHQIRQLRLQLEEQRIRNNSLSERINELSISDSDGVLGMKATTKKKKANKKTAATKNKKQPAATKKKTATTTAAVPNSNNDTSFSSMSNPCCILVKSYFGKVETVEMPSSGSITVSDVKNKIIRTKFIREEDRGVVNFIDAQTRELLKDTDIIINEEDVYVLYVVLGENPKHTGAIQRGDSDIYVPSCRNGFSSPDTSVAAASMGNSSTLDDSSSVDDGVWEAMGFPSWLTVEGVYTSEKGYQEYNPSTFTVHEDHEAAYLGTWIVPPGIVSSVREINNGGIGFADLLLSVKIGESDSFDNAMKKFHKKRTYICFAQHMFVLILHRGNSVDIESALHARFALKKGDAHGEFYCISQLDIFDTIAHFEKFPDVTIVFCRTNRFPKCTFGPTESMIPSESGYVYRYWYKWTEQHSRVIQELKRKHGNLASTMPILNITRNAEDLCRRLEATKIGMHTCDENEDELRHYTYKSACWANGMIDQIDCKSIYCDHPNIVEREIHNTLEDHNLGGEWFDGGVCPNPLEEEYEPLFGNVEPAVYYRNREQPCKLFTKNAFRRYVELYELLTYKLVWEQIILGAISIVGNHDPTFSELEKLLLECLDPSDKPPLKKSDIHFVVKTDMFEDDHDSVDDTVVDNAIKNVLEKVKCIRVVLGNKNTFNAISEQDAIEIFTTIFGEDKREKAEEFSSHS